jgi:tetratricopeptide (TPR) repeat protein
VISGWYEVLENDLWIKAENGAWFPIEKLISLDKDNDIAIFKVDGKGLPTVKIAIGYKPKQGEGIFVIGNPLGLETTVSDGIISSLRGKGKLIQITAPVSEGSSGSPVFNSKGKVIGAATFYIKGGQNLNFAIPVKYVVNLLNESKKPEKKRKQYGTFTPITTLEPAPVPEAPAPAPSPELVDILEKAKAKVRENPDSADAHFGLGVAYVILGMYREALEAYKQAIRIKPDDAKAHYGLGVAYLLFNDSGSALDEYKILKELDSEKANKLFNLIYK